MLAIRGCRYLLGRSLHRSLPRPSASAPCQLSKYGEEETRLVSLLVPARTLNHGWSNSASPSPPLFTARAGLSLVRRLCAHSTAQVLAGSCLSKLLCPPTCVGCYGRLALRLTNSSLSSLAAFCPGGGVGTHAEQPLQASEGTLDGTDEGQAVTTLTIRLMDGSRLTGRFNTSHTVGDIHRYAPFFASRLWP